MNLENDLFMDILNLLKIHLDKSMENRKCFHDFETTHSGHCDISGTETGNKIGWE